MIRVQYVPVWDEDREAAHADQVANQIAFIKAEMDRQATNGTSAPITAPLDLRGSANGFRFFRSPSLPGTVEFEPRGGSGLLLTAPSITIQESGGTSFFGITETWQTIVDGVVVGPIDNTLHLRVRVPNPQALATGVSSTLTLRDSSNAYAGKIVMVTGDDAVFVSTYGASSTTVPITNRLDDTDPDGPTFYFNLLDDDLLFEAVLHAASAPYTLVLDEAGLPAQYNIVYDRVTATGTERFGADIGLTTLNYAYPAPAGALRVSTRSTAMPDQTFVLEHGAVILEQADGTVMLVPPSFGVEKGPVQDRIKLTLPTLDGVGSALAVPQASLTVEAVTSPLSLSAFLPRFTLTLPTDHPAIWGDFWTQRLDEAGFVAGEYSVQLTGTSATLNVFGPVPAPGSTTNDIFLLLQQATIEVNLFPSG